MPKVSVIIPIYNTEQYLSECVESVRNQTLRDIEIILVDDESPDNAPQMCDEYALKDERIKVVHKKNGGLGFARNSGLNVATGEYVSFVDSDDFIRLDMLERLYSVAKEYDADDVRSGTIFYENGTKTIRRDVEQTKVYRGREAVKSFVFDLVGPLPEDKRDVKYMMSVCLAIHKRNVIEEHGVRFTSERETLSEDLIFDLDLFPEMNCIVCVPDCYYHYRMNPDSLTHYFSMEKYRRYETFFKLMYKRLCDVYKPEEFKLHYMRIKFLYLRCAISGCMHTQESFFTKVKNVNYIINDSLWLDLWSSYPYKRMDFRHLLYFRLLKSKIAMIIAVITQTLS